MHRPGMAVQIPGGWPKGAAEVLRPARGRPRQCSPRHLALAARQPLRLVRATRLELRLLMVSHLASPAVTAGCGLFTRYRGSSLGPGQHSCPGPICLAAPLLCLLEYFYQVESRKTGSYINILSFQSYCSTYCLCQEFQKSVLKLKS